MTDRITAEEELREMLATALNPHAFSDDETVRRQHCGPFREEELQDATRLAAGNILSALAAHGLPTDALLAVLRGEAVVVPVEIDDDALVDRLARAVSTSRAISDEGDFPLLMDLLDMSEHNLTLVTRAAARAVLRALEGGE